MSTRKKNSAGSIFSNPISDGQAKDTGMAMVLIFLLIGIFADNRLSLSAALVLLIVNMIWPPLFKPVARLWIGLSFLLGTVMSKVLLTVVFFLVVTPVGIVRKWLGADAMQLKQWKTDTSSVFNVRRKIYRPADLEKPY